MMPLFVGAQLLIPAKEDIQHERLSEWMNLWSPTVTHLTPAMGQILVGGATTKFPALRHVFFVGDVLTARDCKALRNLGSSCTIINMYGSTETSRKVLAQFKFLLECFPSVEPLLRISLEGRICRPHTPQAYTPSIC
jgi:L-aminoadipate-semialdehyde dehydrogenase